MARAPTAGVVVEVAELRVLGFRRVGCRSLAALEKGEEGKIGSGDATSWGWQFDSWWARERAWRGSWTIGGAEWAGRDRHLAVRSGVGSCREDDRRRGRAPFATRHSPLA